MTPPEVAQLQRRTLRVLVASQALGGLGISVGIAVAAVLARDVSGSEALAGLVQTAQVVGTALASYLLARLMGRHGRRVGMVTGYAIGGAGALTCVLGGAVGSYPVLVLGGLLLGATGATNYQTRYAATDLAEPDHRARAVATVMWATTFGAVLGPNLVGPAGAAAVDLGLPRLTGAFLLSAVVVGLAAVVGLVLLRPDPLQTALALAAEDAATRDEPAGEVPGFLELVRRTPAIGWAVLAMSASHAVMVAVMVMTPLHMDHGGAELELIGLVISVHVLGMYFFSPAMGWVADHAGRTPLLGLGGVLLLVACLLAGLSPEGGSLVIGVGLLLLGVGWSACTVAASTLLTDATPIAHRTRVQGSADLVMNLSAAVAGAAGGVVVDLTSYAVLNVFAALLVAGVLVAAVRLRVRPVPAPIS
ncbi:MFS transporter [Nocardioides marmoribigeumensis]|uniref:MFS family permease n=1 Tax=Nocardioides marmoribigeumensis TaxID=433649 RepID=A0ABU2BPE3_9ACTN|nr:MFS transporter [Nocardioides marmoribigeumensis]MDR7360503.1 MFS family permease [Nocardioides marmoribigeumensis]